MKWAIGIDLGGSHVTAAAVDERGKIKSRHKRELNSLDVKIVVNEIARAVEKALDGVRGKKVVGIGIGAPGNIDDKTGVVRFSPNFGWTDVPLRSKLEKKLGRSVRILNDARCATLGEYLHGTGKGTKEFALITIGTGLGGGFVCGGKLVLGYAMGAGEVGHHTIRPDTGFVCNCGKIGCFEAQASGMALLRHAMAVAPSFPYSALFMTPKEQWGSKMITRAASAGDEHGLAAWNRFLVDLSIGVSNIVAFTNPEVIALGGGVGQTDDALLAIPLTKMVDERTTMVPKGQTTIVRAKLGNDAGVVGSAMLAMHGLP